MNSSIRHRPSVAWSLVLCLAISHTACSDDPQPAASDGGVATDAADEVRDGSFDLDQPPFDGTGTITGQVLTPLGDRLSPVGGAVVTIEGGERVTADDSGVFVIEGVEAETSIQVQVAGPVWNPRNPRTRVIYSTTQVLVDVREDQVVSVFPKLLLGCAWTQDAEVGGTVDLESCGAGGPIRVSVPAFAWENADGDVHEGSVRLELATLNPTSGSHGAVLPDDGLAASDPDRVQVLGAGEFRAVDPATREALQIAAGEVVTVQVAFGELPDGASESDLGWSWYDEVDASWVEEGVGEIIERDGHRFYEYDAPHFSMGGPTYRGTGASNTALACLQLYPRLEPITFECVGDDDCPDGPDGRGRPCSSGVCGCGSDLQCSNSEVCDTNTGTCSPVACDASNPCRLGLDGNALRCVDGSCTCNSSNQCPGDLTCVDGGCRATNATIDVFVDNVFWDTLLPSRGCHFVPHDRDLTLQVRYVNPLAILAGLSPIYEWISTPQRFPPIPREDLEVPPPLTTPALQYACWHSTSCEPYRDAFTSSPPLLRAQSRSCVSGRLVAPCGVDCLSPVQGAVHVRQDGAVVGIGQADSVGFFCASTFLTGGELELTQGFEYPEANYFTGDFTPSGDPGANCPTPHDVDWPVGGCQDVGEMTVRCEPGDEHADCLRANLELAPTALADGTFDLTMDGSGSNGPVVYYEYEIFSGRDELGPFYTSVTTTEPALTINLTPGDYTVLLTVSNGRRWEWAFDREAIALEDEVFVPLSRFWFGRFGPPEIRALLDHLLEPGASIINFDSPAVWAQVSGFRIDRTEVTQAQYARCVEAGSCTPPNDVNVGCETIYNPTASPNHPVVCVSYDQASNYCRFTGARLPTEAEWELAAGGADWHFGGCRPDDPWASTFLPEDGWCGVGMSRSYPWGHEPGVDCRQANSRHFEAPTEGGETCDCIVGDNCVLGRLVDEPYPCRGASDCNRNASICPSGDCVCFDARCLPAGDECTDSLECGTGVSCIDERCAVPDLRESCESVADCPDGFECSGGLCDHPALECADNSSCPPGFYCFRGRCGHEPLACASDGSCPGGDQVCCDDHCVEPEPFACVGELVPVGSHRDGASFYGLLDMSGNVSEWVLDYYREHEPTLLFREWLRGDVESLSYRQAPMTIDPRGPQSGTERVVRGSGAMSDDPQEDRTDLRFGVSPASASPTLGFRCAIGSNDPPRIDIDCNSCDDRLVVGGGCAHPAGGNFVPSVGCQDGAGFFVSVFTTNTSCDAPNLAEMGCTATFNGRELDLAACTDYTCSTGPPFADECAGGTMENRFCTPPSGESCSASMEVVVTCPDSSSACHILDLRASGPCD